MSGTRQCSHGLVFIVLVAAGMLSVEAHVPRAASPPCTNKAGALVPCPKSSSFSAPVIAAIVVPAVLAVSIAGFFLYRALRRRGGITYYAALSAPIPSGEQQASSGVMVPAAPGEMGYAGTQPYPTTLSYPAPLAHSSESSHALPSLSKDIEAPPEPGQGGPRASLSETATTSSKYAPTTFSKYAPTTSSVNTTNATAKDAATHYGFSMGAI